MLQQRGSVSYRGCGGDRQRFEPDEDRRHRIHRQLRLEERTDLQGRTGHFLPSGGKKPSWAAEVNSKLCIEELGELVTSTMPIASYAAVQDEPVCSSVHDYIGTLLDACTAPDAWFQFPKPGMRYMHALAMTWNFLPAGQCVFPGAPF